MVRNHVFYGPSYRKVRDSNRCVKLFYKDRIAVFARSRANQNMENKIENRRWQGRSYRFFGRLVSPGEIRHWQGKRIRSHQEGYRETLSSDETRLWLGRTLAISKNEFWGGCAGCLSDGARDAIFYGCRSMPSYTLTGGLMESALVFHFCHPKIPLRLLQ